ncbi:Cuticle protein 16.8 like protein [Argiope bruennichi]|uniref:Cuticle protein 16.8 like protein n=1 Tax=Argiope bruennichi TaxID=94029 RepID=A0A8T0E975_ARGBR|nr:Cuticle protein 16.8 like protein [Argiope bruennichi]
MKIIKLLQVHHVPVEHHAPQPYAFGYSVKDHHGEQHREEAGDGHGVKGSYGFTDDRGVHRQVNYVADHGGFRAQVKTNEPGTANQNPAAVHMISDAPYAHGHDHHGVVPVVDAVIVPAHHGHHEHGYAGVHHGHGYAGVHHGHHGYGYAAPYAGYGYAGVPYGGGYGYGLANGLLGGLGYYRYGY